MRKSTLQERRKKSLNKKLFLDIIKESIVISNIEKTFKAMGKDPVAAVKGVSLDIYEGEITAILGQSSTKNKKKVAC